MIDKKYMAIPPGAIIPGALPEFKIYVLVSEGKYVLWALKGQAVSAAQLGKLVEGGFNEVYVDLEERIKYEQYLEDHLGSILDSAWSTDDQKADIFSKVSVNVVKTSFEASLGMGTMGAESLYRLRRMVQSALNFIMDSNSLRSLAKMINHDYQTYEHAAKVLWFTVAFLRHNPDVLKQIQPAYEEFDQKLAMEMLGQCGVAALLHDIGKTLVPAEILNKTGPLTDVEWEIVRRHPLNGLAMLFDTDLPDFVKKAILHHHEDFHGGGYPMALEGRHISVLARVLRIVDSFDAMTSRRPYKEPISPGKAIQIMIGALGNKGGDNDDPLSDDRRDREMKHCFDEALLRKFILFLGNVDLNR